MNSYTYIYKFYSHAFKKYTIKMDIIRNEMKLNNTITTKTKIRNNI